MLHERESERAGYVKAGFLPHAFLSLFLSLLLTYKTTLRSPNGALPTSVRSHFQRETTHAIYIIFLLLQSARLPARQQLSPFHNTPAGAGSFPGLAAHILDRPGLGQTYRGMLQERREKVFEERSSVLFSVTSLSSST